MQKKIISIILSVSIVLLGVVPCFAIENSTGSAIKSLNSVNDTRATSPSTTVEPEDSTANRYYVNSNGSVTSSSVYINTWGNIVNDLTYSIAYSIGEVVSRLTTINNNVVNYLFSNASTGYYLWDWTSTNGVYQGAPTSPQSVISQLRAMGSSITKMLSYNTEYAYQLYQLISNGGLVDKVKIDNNTDNNFTYDYIWKKNYTQTARPVPWINENGNLDNMSINTQTRSILGYINLLIDTINWNTAYGFKHLISGVYNDQASNYYLYNSDLTTTSPNKISLWRDVRVIGGNLSMHLSRLAYVLASDEEIEARQAAADNQESVVDNFIKPTGTGAASASDFADVAAVGSNIKDALNSNVSVENAFSSLSSNSSAWDWFTQSTANSLDSTTNQNRKSTNYDTPLLDTYYSDLMEILKVK